MDIDYETLVSNALVQSYEALKALGPRGDSETRGNRFGETALLADIEAEKSVIDVIEQSPLRVHIVSEEHGELDVGSGAETDQVLLRKPAFSPFSSPRGCGQAAYGLLGVLDGLDGSGLYPKGGRCGTMFCLFANENPLYGEFLAAGIMEHSTSRLFLATTDKPLQVVDLLSGDRSFPWVATRQSIDVGAVCFADSSKPGNPDHPLSDYFVLNSKMADALLAQGITTQRSGSTAANIADVAVGRALFDLSATRKNNLEFATAVAVITAAGGVVQTLDGRDLRKERVLEFGQGPRNHIPVIAAANSSIASQLARIIAPVLTPEP